MDQTEAQRKEVRALIVKHLKEALKRGVSRERLLVEELPRVWEKIREAGYIIPQFKVQQFEFDAIRKYLEFKHGIRVKNAKKKINLQRTQQVNR